MDDGELDYLPEQFRTSARHNHEAAEVADGLSRRLSGTSAASTHFGGARASGFTGGLNAGTGSRARAVRRAQELRDGVGEGGSLAADLGEETDDRAHQALRAPSGSAVSRAVADGM
ncbi:MULTISPECIES: hypothetical protein [Streptomyces]|uniref:hypothetical protein n=1 Tax=Streptomyces TaxID=1883 RepID=UPI0022495D4C|nr:hypothetical protein [Streptomyces sp. JHD 1]MCX2968563.1 hypothetical protein [Streptomyces sp. JHD 1]